MKFFTSAAPMSSDIKDALVTKNGRESFIDFLNSRAAGQDSHLQLQAGDGKVVELSTEPVSTGNDSAAA